MLYDEKSNALVPYDFPGYALGYLFVDSTKTHAYSGFAEGSYRFTDRLTFTAGARYSYEKKYWGGCVTGYTDYYTNFNPAACDGKLVPDQKNSHVVTPRFVLDFNATQDLLLYASATRGFRSGGWNFTDATVAGARNGFSPEYVWSYEAGLKSELFDRKLRFNLAAFWADYSQLLVRVPDPVTFLLQTRNAGAATIKGVEVEADAKPLRGLDLNATMSWLDAKYTKFTFAQANGEVIDYAGNRLNNAPEWEVNLSGQYKIELGTAGSLTPRVEYRYVSEIFDTQDNIQPQGSDPFSLVNLRLSYDPPHGQWGVQAFVENVTDKQYRTHTFAPPFPDNQPATISDPRTYGVSVHYRW